MLSLLKQLHWVKRYNLSSKYMHNKLSIMQKHWLLHCRKRLTIVSGGTDTHVMLVDVRNTGLTGKEAEHLLDEVGITCNKNTIPFDPASPFVTSGIRLGTPALTTRGLQVKDMEEIADIIATVLKNPEDKAVHEDASKRVAALCEAYPLY